MAATVAAWTGRARLKAGGGQGTRGAHLEHVVHGRDLGRVEAERLVEHRRALPSRKAGMRCGKRCGPGGVTALGGGDAIGMHGEGPTQGCGGQGTRGAHLEHLAHIRDAGRVEAERLVERRRELPSRKAGMRCEKRCGSGGVRALWVAATQAACTGRARLKAVGAKARAERTWNISAMVVTLDVSKLSGWLNAEAYCRVERRAWRMRCGARYSPRGVRAMWVAETQSACTGRARLKAVGDRARAERT